MNHGTNLSYTLSFVLRIRPDKEIFDQELFSGNCRKAHGTITEPAIHQNSHQFFISRSLVLDRVTDAIALHKGADLIRGVGPRIDQDVAGLSRHHLSILDYEGAQETILHGKHKEVIVPGVLR